MAVCRYSCVLALALGCSVDSDSGFTGVSGGSAATTLPSTTTAAGSETSGSEGASEGSSSGGDPSAPGSTSADESSSAATAATAESGSEGASSEASSGGDGTPLDPELDVPDMGEHCTNPGDLQECAGIAVCRFATVEYGICESCDACGNLNDPCVQGTDCDILFMCYAGSCTNFCTLGTFECGPVEACLDIGHPTLGVCDPFA